MTKTEKKEALQKIAQELEAVERRLLEMDKEELQQALKKCELKYNEIEEERNILKQILQDIRKATNSLGKLYKSDRKKSLFPGVQKLANRFVKICKSDQQKDFLKSLPEDEL